MVTRNTSFAPGEYYHVYNRGVEKRVIFTDNDDYYRFQQLLYVSNSVDYVNVRDLFMVYKDLLAAPRDEPLVAIGAYCLMPNHFHILLTPLVDDGVSQFMNKLGTSYAMYFNKRHQRTGRLFEGSYKAKHVEYDQYLKYLFSYIHLNPVKIIQPDWKKRAIQNPKQALAYATDYRYSSLQDIHFSERAEAKIIDMQPFPHYFLTTAESRMELLHWLTFRDQIPKG